MDKFKSDVTALLGCTLSKAQVEAFAWYEKELLAWNERFNLTAICEPVEIRAKHFLDSLSCALVINSTRSGALIDIGTGAGFPGIPLKIIFPHLRLTLVESIGKKAEFCRHVVVSLGLGQTTVLQNRAEELGQDILHREQYDYAVARAVANLNTLVEYLLPLLKPGGMMIAQKGISGPEEAQNAERAARIMGGHLRQVRKINIPGIAEDRFLVTFDKTAPTPPQFPRHVGVPTKKPIR